LALKLSSIFYIRDLNHAIKIHVKENESIS